MCVFFVFFFCLIFSTRSVDIPNSILDPLELNPWDQICIRVSKGQCEKGAGCGWKGRSNVSMCVSVWVFFVVVVYVFGWTKHPYLWGFLLDYILKPMQRVGCGRGLGGTRVGLFAVKRLFEIYKSNRRFYKKYNKYFFSKINYQCSYFDHEEVKCVLSLDSKS